jgi:hypothetical protein
MFSPSAKAVPTVGLIQQRREVLCFANFFSDPGVVRELSPEGAWIDPQAEHPLGKPSFLSS